jgi:hypothetical protein
MRERERESYVEQDGRVSDPSSKIRKSQKTLEDGTDTLSRNVDK